MKELLLSTHSCHWEGMSEYLEDKVLLFPNIENPLLLNYIQWQIFSIPIDKSKIFNENLKRARQPIEVALDRHDEETRRKYWLRLNTSVSCLIYLLRQGLPFRDHDEFEESKK